MPRTRNRNKNYEIGRRNRQRGIFKKSFTYFDFYQEDIAVIIKGKNGQGCAWESSNGFIKTHVPSLIHSLSHISNSDDFLTVNHRQRQQTALEHGAPCENYGTWPISSGSYSSSSPYPYLDGNQVGDVADLTASPAWTTGSTSTDANELPQTQIDFGSRVDMIAAAQQVADYQALFETPGAAMDLTLFDTDLSLGAGGHLPQTPSTIMCAPTVISSTPKKGLSEPTVHPNVLSIESPRPLSLVKKQRLLTLVNDLTSCIRK